MVPSFSSGDIVVLLIRIGRTTFRAENALQFCDHYFEGDQDSDYLNAASCGPGRSTDEHEQHKHSFAEKRPQIEVGGAEARSGLQ